MDNAGESASETGGLGEDSAKMIFPGNRGKVRIFFGDGDEIPGRRDKPRGPCPSEEIKKKSVHLQIFSALRSDKKECSLEIELSNEGVDAGRLDAIQNMESCTASAETERGDQFRGQAGATDSEENYVGEALLFQGLPKAGNQLVACFEVVSQVQPAQNMRSEFAFGAIRGPERKIASPES